MTRLHALKRPWYEKKRQVDPCVIVVTFVGLVMSLAIVGALFGGKDLEPAAAAKARVTERTGLTPST